MNFGAGAPRHTFKLAALVEGVPPFAERIINAHFQTLRSGGGLQFPEQVAMGTAIIGVPAIAEFGDGIFGRMHRETVMEIGGNDDVFCAGFPDQGGPFVRVKAFAGEHRHKLVVGELSAPDTVVVFLGGAACVEEVVAMPLGILPFRRPTGDRIEAPKR